MFVASSPSLLQNAFFLSLFLIRIFIVVKMTTNGTTKEERRVGSHEVVLN